MPRPELEVRMPVKFVDMMMAGEITGSMLLTMLMLYRWANWRTGRVDRVSAQGLATASNDAYHKNTFQDALKRWDDTGYIKREMTPCSKKQFPVVINNFRVRVKTKGKDGEPVMKSCLINKSSTITYAEFKKGVRVEPLAEGVEEGVDEALAEGVEDSVRKVGTELASNEHLLADDEQDCLQDELAGDEQEQQQQPAAAVATSSSEEQKPKTTEIEIESKSLAQRFWEYLGSPEKFSPSRWEKQFSELLSAYPGLGEILEYAFEKDSTKTWRNRLLGANTPVAYLRKVLPHIQEAYDKWLPLEAERTEKAAVLCIHDSVNNLLASGEVFVRDGHNYKFLAVQGYKPCYHEIDGHGNPMGVIGNLVLGLDLPLPEDALEDAGYDV